MAHDQILQMRRHGGLGSGVPLKRFVNIANVARRKLRQLQIASQLENLRVPPGNHLETQKGIVPVSTVFASTISGASASVGPMPAQRMWKSWILSRASTPFPRIRICGYAVSLDCPASAKSLARRNVDHDAIAAVELKRA